MKRLHKWWRLIMQRLDEDIDRHVELAFGDLIRAAELGGRYERLRKHYPNILARLDAAADRKEVKLKHRC